MKFEILHFISYEVMLQSGRMHVAQTQQVGELCELKFKNYQGEFLWYELPIM